ncbi:hypothetical protein IFR05_015721 [Cadophora sp. M221]|nr:hypothetical protein IFR05_015721 [Cadophora sp. M221]
MARPDALFTRFSSLPIELRYRVWAFAATHSRFVSIFDYQPKPTRRRGLTKQRLYKSNTLAPAILHVSTESRTEGLRYYEKLACRGLATYINWDHDFLTILDPNFWWRFDWSGSDLATKATQCRQLAIYPGYTNYRLQTSGNFPALECLLIVSKILSDETSDLQTLELVSPIQAQEIVATGDNEAIMREWFRNFHAHSTSHKVRIDYAELCNSRHRTMIAKEKSDRSARKLIEARTSLSPKRPSMPVKANYTWARLPVLRQEAEALHLSTDGRRKDLIHRLDGIEELRFTQAMTDWKRDLKQWRDSAGFSSTVGA